MALRVDRLDESARVLKEENYSVSRGAFGLAVVFKGRQRLGHLINALARNNIFAEMTDIADSMYQG